MKEISFSDVVIVLKLLFKPCTSLMVSLNVKDDLEEFFRSDSTARKFFRSLAVWGLGSRTFIRVVFVFFMEDFVGLFCIGVNFSPAVDLLFDAIGDLLFSKKLHDKVAE